ncbi:spermine oxidase-like, partial [Chrysoperla carnea]|uniref:spermine oxidase-like n=1 Tax=Chrysoperla carnea TaxID=189513 RepID=UPI001D07E39E
FATDPNVIIIGSGPAGIAAGTRLYENGITNILWLEAESRIGGRINTQKFAANVIEIGAQWCHGEKDNVVYEMANPLGLLELPNSGSDELDKFPDIYTSFGTLLPKLETHKINGILEDIVKDYEEMEKFNGSVGEFIQLKFSNKLDNEMKEIDRNLSTYVLDWTHKKNSLSEASDSLYDVSAKDAGDNWVRERNNLNWKGRGYKTILDLLMKKLPDPKKSLPIEDKILLNKEVINIIWNSNQNGVTVKCADGSEYKADHVIVTVSLGVLKDRIGSLFQPELPPSKLNAIRGLNMGTVDKLIFEFSEPWWPKNHPGFKSNKWLSDVQGFSKIEHQPNLLLGWVVGESARQMETIPDDEVKAKLMQLMRMFLGHNYNIPEPDTFIRSKWFTNPNFRGAYTYNSLTTDQLNASRMDLQEPLKNSSGQDVVLFAGEATNQHRYSTVHGAIETGWHMDNFNFKAFILINLILNVFATDPSVIIIGTGPAGIAAGTKLYENGIKNILWLEAENRIGGRINTQKFGANVIEIGAQWCHGEKDNVVYEMAYPLGLLVHSNSGFDVLDRFPDIYTSFGTKLPKIETHKINGILEDIVMDYAEMKKFNGSVGEFIQLKFSNKLDNEMKETDRNLSTYVLDWTHKMNSLLEASDSLYDVSAKGSAEYWGCEGDNLNWNGRGYKTILDLLMKKLPDPKKALPLEDKMLLNKEVINIVWNSNQNGVTVKCADGSEYKADHVIVTVSLGVLKDRFNSLFEPKLPPSKLNAIRGLNIGTVDKLIFEFSKPWWPKNHSDFVFVWQKHEIDEQLKKFNGSLESNKWLSDVVGFAEIEHQPNLLLGWIVGESARQMETIPEDEVKAKLIQLMRMFMGHYYNIPEPDTFIRSKWFTNPHFRGSYTYNSITTDQLNASRIDLQEPLKNSSGHDVVLFAGEATNEHRYATVHGAIETGWREAGRLLKLKN